MESAVENKERREGHVLAADKPHQRLLWPGIARCQEQCHAIDCQNYGNGVPHHRYEGFQDIGKRAGERQHRIVHIGAARENMNGQGER